MTRISRSRWSRWTVGALRAATLGSALAAASLRPGLALAAESGQPSVPASWRLGVEELRLPGGERTGLLGTSLLVGIGDRWFVGPALYSAASGRRGGLFVLGGEAMWRGGGPFGSRVEAGLFLGGGGGAAAPVGGGLMLRPHLDWSWPIGPGWLGVSASRVVFPSGQIGSGQLGLVYSVDDRFRFTTVGSPARTSFTGRAGVGFDRVWLAVGRYRGSSGQRHGYGQVRVDHWLRPGTYVFLEGAGAAQGGADGYAEFLGGAGVEWPLFTAPGTAAAGRAVHLGLRAAAGLAGGGAIDTGGGALVKLAGTLRWNLPQDLVLGLEAGRTVAPDGRFRATHLQLSLGLTLDRPEASGAAAGDAPWRSDLLEWSAAVAHFPAMRYRDGREDAVETVGLRLRRPLSAALDERLQLAGAAHFAAGGRAGAYGAGLIGIAWASPVQQPGWQWGAELLAGAAGGGGIETRGGAIVQPMLRAGWARGPQRWHLGIGQVHALRGGLSSPVIELNYGAAVGLPRR